MLHGDAVVQICTLVIGSALAGPKFGTASGPLVVGVALGDVPGEVDARADGVGCVPLVTGLPPRLARTITPKIPSRMTIATATAAGTSQGGRSASGPPRDGGRATGLRAGAAIGARGTGTGVGALGGVSTTATPLPRGSAGTVSPGFHTGASTGVQVCCAGGAEGAGASAGAGVAGGYVAKGDAGATLSNDGAGLGTSGSAGFGGSASTGFDGSNGVQVGGAGGLVARGLSLAAGSNGVEGREGGSSQVGTAGAGLAGAVGLGGGGAGVGAGVGGNVIAGIAGYVCKGRSGASYDAGERTGVSSRRAGAM